MKELLTDWTFWAVVASFAAIILSQLPPVKYWFKSSNLDIELYSRVWLTHKIGNPNLQVHVIITNIGGRQVKVRKLEAHLERNNRDVFVLPIQNYYLQANDKDTVLFTPFSLQPDEDWSHISNFLNFFDRDDEQRYRDIESRLRQDISAKKTINPDALVEADDANVQPIIEFFNEKFRWLPGEYHITLKAVTTDKEYSKKYRFTLFETESNELRSHANDYKYGARVYWEPTNYGTPGIFVQIRDENT